MGPGRPLHTQKLVILLVVRFNLTIFECSLDGNERAVCIDFSKCDMIFEKKCDRSAGASEEKSICLLFLLLGVGFLMLVTFGFEIWLVVTGDCLRPLRFVEIDRRQRVVPWNRISKCNQKCYSYKRAETATFLLYS